MFIVILDKLFVRCREKIILPPKHPKYTLTTRVMPQLPANPPDSQDKWPLYVNTKPSNCKPSSWKYKIDNWLQMCRNLSIKKIWTKVKWFRKLSFRKRLWHSFRNKKIIRLKWSKLRMKRISIGLEESIRIKLKMFRERLNLGNLWERIWPKNTRILRISAKNYEIHSKT